MDQPNNRKPWYRPRNILLAIAGFVIVVAGYLTLEALRLMNAQPNVTVDYRARYRAMATRAAGVPEDYGQQEWDDMLDMLSDARNLLARIEDDLQAANPEPRWEYDFPGLDFEVVLEGGEIRDGMDRERAAIVELREAGIFDRLADLAASSPAFDARPANGMIIQTALSELAEARSFMRARVASARIALEEGDFMETARAFDQCLAIGQTIGYQQTLISWLVGWATQTLALAEIRHELLEADFDVESCRILLDSFDERALPPTSLALEGERGAFLDFVQWCYSDDGSGDGRFLPSQASQLSGTGLLLSSEGPTFVTALLSRFLLDSRKETVDIYNRLMDRAILESDMLLAEWARADDGWIADVEEMVSDGRHSVVGILLPAVGKSIQSGAITRVLYEGTRVMVAIELFRALHGRDPTSLDELVPDVLAELPIDFTHGGSFGYRVLAEPDEYGRTYLLYSTGLDQIDDGGSELDWKNQSGKGPYNAIIDPEASGYDLVINQPREAR